MVKRGGDLSAGGPTDDGITNRCVAHKKTGERCRKSACRGGTVCRSHGGAAPQVRRKAYERILASADLGAQRLIEFMNDKRVPYTVRLGATKDLLDRAGLAAAQTLKIGAADPWEDFLKDVFDDNEVFVPVDPKPRALSPGRDADDPDGDDDGSSLEDPHPDDDVSADDLPRRLNNADHRVIRGEVVPDDDLPRLRERWHPPGGGRRDDDPPPHVDPDGLAASTRRRRDPGAVEWG